MKSKEIQKKLNELVKICNELDDESKRRYGKDGSLFFESDGRFHLMSDDADPDREGALDRMKFVKFSSDGYCQLGAGAW